MRWHAPDKKIGLGFRFENNLVPYDLDPKMRYLDHKAAFTFYSINFPKSQSAILSAGVRTPPYPHYPLILGVLRNKVSERFYNVSEIPPDVCPVYRRGTRDRGCDIIERLPPPG